MSIKDKEIIICDYHQQGAEYAARMRLDRKDVLIFTRPEQIMAHEFDSCVMLTNDLNLRRLTQTRMGRKAS